ncbi:hypothetical protein M758_8G009800 [Ceratodon purpureus]|uniref:Uncharacterized protein n=1 Tax=Ceratodon purpureus TaxID=3225 RepID=A0A8T0H255_CERPU|nr:hypothetical protein KC19_8G010400 [Ceratodon purpureus]KAG0607215.1 hypothetical protein M758_8G009800 [Ceratodon purpureus]
MSHCKNQTNSPTNSQSLNLNKNKTNPANQNRIQKREPPIFTPQHRFPQSMSYHTSKPKPKQISTIPTPSSPQEPPHAQGLSHPYTHSRQISYATNVHKQM